MSQLGACPHADKVRSLEVERFISESKMCPMMQIGVIGINHKYAGVGAREQLARVYEKIFGSEWKLPRDYSYVLLSTCNRTEVYFSSSDLGVTHYQLQKEIRKELPFLPENILYSHFAYDCFKHLSRVTAGLDSSIIAETEIQGQVKKAYASAASIRHLTKELHFLFQKSFHIGKTLRTTLNIGRGVPGHEEAIIYAGKFLWKDFNQRKILFVGASEINRKVLRGFQAKGFKELSVCNRTESYGMEFAKREEVSFIPWESLELWHHYDLIIFGTKSPHFLLETKDLPSNNMQRKLIIDLSVPRNVDSDIEKHQQVFLMNIDEVNSVIEKNRGRKESEIVTAERAIEEHVKRLMTIYHDREMRANISKECEVAR